jgi:hypothetical protein
MDWIHLSQGVDQWQFLHGNEPLRFDMGDFLMTN